MADCLTNKFSSDLEKVIRTRADILIGPWPDSLKMSVDANETGFRIDLGPARHPKDKRYRSRVMQIISAIKLEIRLTELKNRAHAHAAVL